jgi:hypothetical protein
MSVGAFLQSLSIENAILLIGSLALLLVVVGLHVRNNRRVQRLASGDATSEAKARIEKLIDAVETLSAAARKPVVTAHRPAGKERRQVPAARSAKPIIAIRRAR